MVLNCQELFLIFSYRKTSLFYFFRVILCSKVHTEPQNGGNYTMTIGERIKKIRVFRKMTMDDLGGALGFEGKNMSVRIS